LCVLEFRAVEREERRGANEAYFREVNERVEEQVKDLAGSDAVFNILCECSDLTCSRRIALTPDEYESAHEDPRQFIVLPGHAEAGIEDSVVTTDRFVIVRKRGRAGEVAEDAAQESG